jgi:hypothetical protein
VGGKNVVIVHRFIRPDKLLWRGRLEHGTRTMNAREHVKRGRVWLAITFSVAVLYILFVPSDGIFANPALRGVGVIVCGMIPYTVVMWHWLAARRARARGDLGPTLSQDNQKRDRAIGMILLIIGVVAVIARLILAEIGH